MFFEFAAWQAGLTPSPSGPQLGWIVNLTSLNPRTLLEAIERFYSTRNAVPGYPDYRAPLAPGAIVGAPNLSLGIDGVGADKRWDHLIYAYMIENTRIFEIFDRIIREYEAGEKFETPDPETALWLRSTEALFYRDLPSGFIGALTSSIRPDLRATRRNTYYRLLGFDLNHGRDGTQPYPFDKPTAANRDFVNTFETLLREVWRGAVNAANTTGPKDTDDAAIANSVKRLREMLNVRRNNGNLLLEEFWAVVTMSWFHLIVMEDTPIVRAMKCEAESPADRLRKLGERVGVPAHSFSDAYFNLAFPLSAVLKLIEDPSPLPTITPAAAPAFYTPGGTFPTLADDMRKIISYWSAATGRDVKAVPVSSRSQTAVLARP